MKRPARARGRAYRCPCGNEKLRLTREGVAARVDRWGYLFGECGGGVKLRFEGARVVETRDVDLQEAERIRSLPARKVDPYEQILQAVDDKARRRLEEIVVEIRGALEQGMARWIAVGQLLCEAKRLLKKGDFGAWVERNGLDRVHAHRFIAAWEMCRRSPAFSQTSVKIGWEKTALLASPRLSEVKRLEILEHGIPLNGGAPTPVDQVTFRQLNAYVRSIVGKSPRGRKAKGEAGEKPTERWGLPIELVEAFQGAAKGLQALKKFARDGWADKQRPVVAKLWGSVNHLFFHLQDELGMAELLGRR